MKSRFIIHIPTSTHEATSLAFHRVAGVPLFLRPILTLAEAGHTSFIIVTPLNQRRNILRSWQRVIKNRPLHLNLITTGHHVTPINEIKELMEDTAYFINSNYVFPKSPTLGTVYPNQAVLYRLLSLRSTIIGINKANLDALPVGMAFESALLALSEKLNHHYLTNQEEGVIVERFADVKFAEELLANHIRENTKTPIAREINKRISLPISMVLARLNISPNSITVFNIMIGLCAGIGAAGKTYIGMLMGAILFQLASIIDGCDGEVAKFTFRSSKFGQYIDSISDNLALGSFLTGLMIHERRVTGSPVAYLWGGALIIGALVIFIFMIQFLKRYTDSASFVTFDREYLERLSDKNVPKWLVKLINHIKILYKKDCFSFLFLLFAIFGILHWWLYIAAVGVWIAAGVLGYLQIIQKSKLQTSNVKIQNKSQITNPKAIDS